MRPIKVVCSLSAMVLAAAIVTTETSGLPVHATAAVAPSGGVHGDITADIESYSSDYDLTFAEGQRRMDLMTANGGLLSAAAKLAGSRFGRAMVVHEPDFGISVSVTGDEPIAALDSLAADAPVPMTVHYGVALSGAELGAVTDRLAGEWSERYPEIVGIGHDGSRSTIQLDIQADEDTAVRIQQEIIRTDDLGGATLEVTAFRGWTF